MSYTYSTGWKRGPQSVDGLITAGAAGAADPSAWSASEPSNLINLNGFRGGSFMFIGDTNNETIQFVFFAIEVDHTEVGIPIIPVAGRPITTYKATEIGTADMVIGTATGAANTLASATELFADTITSWTLTAYGTDLLTKVAGTVEEHSPADNTKAELMFSDFGNIHGLVVAIEDAGGGDAGFIYKLDRQ